LTFTRSKKGPRQAAEAKDSQRRRRNPERARRHEKHSFNLMAAKRLSLPAAARRVPSHGRLGLLRMEPLQAPRGGPPILSIRQKESLAGCADHSEVLNEKHSRGMLRWRKTALLVLVGQRSRDCSRS
jgi:hypothetical protein